MEEKEKESGRGRIKEGGRGVIIKVTKRIHVELEGGHTIVNNWDGSKEAHDDKFDERFENAKDLIGEEVEWTTWGKHDPQKWFAEIKKVDSK